MRHFPLDGSPYAMTLGVRPLLDAPLLEPDAEQLALKRQLLDTDPDFHFQALPGTGPIQREVASALGFSDVPELNALDWVGRQVAEDLLILSDAPAWPLVAGQLCFPNDWCLADKLGRSLLAVHEPVPGFAAQVGEATLKLLDKLKPERPVWRVNWAVKVTDRLDLPPHINAAFEPMKREITAANAGERCFFRIERQTLSRMPASGAILFTVKTSVLPVALLSPEEKQALAVTLHTIPAGMLAYKGLAPFADALQAYLLAA